MSKSDTPALSMDAIDAELDALRRDAERYRWLRARWVQFEGSTLHHSGAGLDLSIDERRAPEGAASTN